MENKGIYVYITFFVTACEKGTEEAVGLLIRYGASTNKSSVQRVTPLHEAVTSKNVEICKMLLQAGANLMAKNKYGIDPLFMAAQCGAAAVLSVLLMKGMPQKHSLKMTKLSICYN